MSVPKPDVLWNDFSQQTAELCALGNVAQLLWVWPEKSLEELDPLKIPWG